MNNKDIMKQIFFVIILFVLILFNGCANVKKDLNIAIDENTEASLYKFMHKHCFGKDIKEECLLADNKLWGIVSTSNNFAGYCNTCCWDYRIVVDYGKRDWCWYF